MARCEIRIDILGPGRFRPGPPRNTKTPFGCFFIWAWQGWAPLEPDTPIMKRPLKGDIYRLIKDELAIPRPNVIPKTYKSDKVFCNHFV